jgi:hypothetical protein
MQTEGAPRSGAAELDPMFKLVNVDPTTGKAQVVLRRGLVPSPFVGLFCLSPFGEANVDSTGKLIDVVNYPETGGCVAVSGYHSD